VIVHAGDGADRITAVNSARPVTVFGEAGNDLIVGSPGNDVVVGGDGDDRLLGRAGNDLLFGGQGRDLLDAGAGEDLLIGGTTTYDLNFAALQAIYAEWNSAAPFTTRRANLETGLAGGVRLALGSTVLDDAAADLLLGLGNDWALSHAGDFVVQWQAVEKVIATTRQVRQQSGGSELFVP
jgi:Ca2+-binding RTX toxin-like protein